MKQYNDSRINTILANLELEMKHDDEYSYRDIDYEWKEVYKNVDKIVAYVSNDYKGNLYLNSNIWQPCLESIDEILKIYNLKFIGSDKITEHEKVISADEYISNQLEKMNITPNTPDDLIQGYFLSINGLSANSIMTSPEEKREYLYNYTLDLIENNCGITHEQRLNYVSKYLKSPDINYNDIKENPDIEMGTIFNFGNYVCEVDDYNQDNPNESIVFIYKSKNDLDNGNYLEQVSLLNKNIKENIEEYMERNYYVKPITRLGLLKEISDQISNDLLAYSESYLMNKPKDGCELEWRKTKEKYNLIKQMIAEEKSRVSSKKKEDIER